MKIRVWDLFVRVFHWSLVILLAANVFFVDHDSDLHQWVGYAVVVAVLLRIVWGFVGKNYARFNSFPPSFEGVIEQLMDLATQRVRIHIGHTPLGALMIYNLLFSMLMIGCSGCLMTTDMFWGAEWTEELHEIFVTWAEISVVAHVAAVVFESRRTKINLPKSMLTGTKEIPDNG